MFILISMFHCWYFLIKREIFNLLKEYFLILLEEGLLLKWTSTYCQWEYTSSYQETSNVTASTEQPQPSTNNQKNLWINYCLTQPGKFPCPADCFLELDYAIFKDCIRHTKRNEVFKVLIEACFQLENLYDLEIDTAAIRKPV